MRLLDTETGQFFAIEPEDEETAYAILSHTWDTEKGEQTYKELKKIQRRYAPSRRRGLQSTSSSHGPSQRLRHWLDRITGESIRFTLPAEL